MRSTTSYRVKRSGHHIVAHLIGAVKTTGRVVCSAASPESSEITETIGLAAAAMFRVLWPKRATR